MLFDCIILGIFGAMLGGEHHKCISSREADRRVKDGARRGVGMWINGKYYLVGQKEPYCTIEEFISGKVKLPRYIPPKH